MTFNTKKYTVLEFGKSSSRISGNYSLSNERIVKKTEEKDLGVIITDKLTFGNHINRITGETYNLRRNLKYSIYIHR